MSNAYKIALFFGVLHGINDFIAGYLLSAHTSIASSMSMNSFVFLLYGMLAFGLQPLAGILVDKQKNNKYFTYVSILFLVLAILFWNKSILIAIICSGIASAFIHVCGGAATFSADKNNTSIAGLFTAPGVLGLISGGILGTFPSVWFYILIIPLLLLFVVIFQIKLPYLESNQPKKYNIDFDTHDFLMILLLLSIAMRSLLWNIFNLYTENQQIWLLGIAIAAFVGKLIGGVICDKYNWKYWIYLSSIVAVLCLQFGKNNLLILCIGVSCLQSTVPITLVLMQHFLSKMPATASGLALGMAIMLAGFPMFLNIFIANYTSSILMLIIVSVFFYSQYKSISTISENKE
jgi:MFS family permease